MRTDPFEGAQDLGRRIAADDPHALEDCYQRFGGAVRAYLRRFVPHPDIDDVTQRVFWEIWKCRARYDPSRSFRAWMLGIARNRAIDHLRVRRHDTVTLDAAAKLSSHDGREMADRHAVSGFVAEALSKLPTAQRTVLLLAHFDGYTQVEIAHLLDVPLGTIKSRTARGLTNLATALESVDHGEVRIAKRSPVPTLAPAAVLLEARSA